MEFNSLVLVLLLSTRVAAATMLVAVLGPTRIPSFARVVLAIAIGGSIALSLPSNGAVSVNTSIELGIAVLREAVIGAGFAFGFAAAYAATQVAGRTLDIQIGFGVAGILNPATETPSPLIGSVFGMVGIALFLALDGHHQLIRALALSAEIARPGVATANFDMQAVLQQSSVMFTFGLMLAAPVMLALLLVDIAMAIYARSLPQLNVFMLSFAIKVALGVVVLALSLKWSQATFESLYQRTFEYWSQQAQMS